MDGVCKLRSTLIGDLKADLCTSWRPKEKPVEEWHGFRRGERVEVGDSKGGKVGGKVVGGRRFWVYVYRDDGVKGIGPDGTWICEDGSITHLPVEHKFKVGDTVRIKILGCKHNGKLGRVVEVKENMIRVYHDGNVHKYFPSKLEPA